MSHLKRLRAPDFWNVPKKKRKWVVRPRPGPHKTFESIPLSILLKNVLGMVDTTTDARKIIKAREVFVDGRPRRDHKYPVGLMDVVDIPRMKKQYRIVPGKKGLSLIEISKKEAKLKLCRIEEKTLLKKGNLQLNLHDGRSIIIPVKDPKKPKEDVYKTGDSLLIELPSQKIIKHIKMENGNSAIITRGQNIGKITKIKQLIIPRSREPNKVVCEEKGEKIETIKDYVFVIGKTKPLIKIQGKLT